MAVTSGVLVFDLSVRDAAAAGTGDGTGLIYLSPFTIPVLRSVEAAYANGTGPQQARKTYESTTTASVATSIDLTNAPCTDGTFGFAHVRIVLVWNLDATRGLRLGVDGVATNVFMGGLLGSNAYAEVPPTGWHVDHRPLGTNGYTVDGTHKTIRLAPQVGGGGAMTWNVVILGD